jgi:ankyrin repeat protein
MPTRSLPPRPNLDQLKRQAHELHRAHADREASAAARIATHHPEMNTLSATAVLERPFALADAQLVVAREYGFRNWAQLKERVELAGRIDSIERHPRFDEALAALDSGDVERLRRLLAEDPSLAHARTNLEPPYGYFTGATLLHHVAGNPGRDHPLPATIVEVARVILDAGADVNALTIGPAPSNSPVTRGANTMGLLVTSKQASDLGVSGPLIDLLLARGAPLDLTSDDALDASLANHAPRAAEKMIELGAKPDVLAAAALGRMDLLRAFFADGRLIALPRRHGREMSERDAIGLALLYAYVRDQREAVDFLLEKDGNWNVIGVNNGTALHRAAVAGDLPMVQRLVARGADTSNRDNPFNSTPLGWADHNNQTEVCRWMREHCAIDLHDAAAFDLRDHLEARLIENPRSVDTRVDQWDIPNATPLHTAADQNRVEIARILLEHGADPSAVAGNGYTPLDVADYQGAAETAALIEQYGGTRAMRVRRTDTGARLEVFESLTNDIFEAYRSGEAGALQRANAFFGSSFDWPRVRSVLQREMDKTAEDEVTLDDVRALFARKRGFATWNAFRESVTLPPERATSWALPLYQIDAAHNTIRVRQGVSDREWDAVFAVMREKGITGLDASGQMTDAALARAATVPTLMRLQFGGTRDVTDAGLKRLAGMRLQDLDLSEYPGGRITDRGLEVLRDLRELKRFQACWQSGISDAGVANLRFCEQLESVDLLGTPTGDGALAALAGKAALRRLKTGRQVTDHALPLLHEIPRFKEWLGGEITYSLMSPDAEPNHLLLDGPFTNAGLAQLGGLDGLFALTFFWHVTALTSAGLATLKDFANLGFVGCQGALCDDEAMRHIAAIPRLRMLMGQGTVATDAGFEALSRSPTLEYIWGRECPNLTGRGFAALSTLPALRGLAVSCKHVDRSALALLPRFPALKELMPMDVADEGFRHVGECTDLERLWCMYCRDTTDVATEHIAGLAKLKTYYAGQTKITDRSLEILSRMPSIEKLEFWSCMRITDEGVARLAALPRLREVVFDDCGHVTTKAASFFGDQVRVRIS